MKILTLFAGLLCVLSSYSIRAQTSHYEKALEAFHRNEVSVAYIHVKNALKEQPDYLPSLLLHCEILLAQAQYRAAELALQQALKSGISQDIYAKLMGSALLGQFKYDEVLSYQNDLILTPEGELWVQLAQAEVFRVQGAYPKAHRIYSQLLKKEPSQLDAKVGQISLWLTEGKRAEAEQALAGLSSGSDRIEVLLLKGRLALAKKEVSQAISLFEKAVEQDNSHPSTLKLLAMAYVRAGQLPSARQVLSKLLRISPNDPYALLMQANLSEQLTTDQPADLMLNQLFSQLSNTSKEFLLNHPQIILIDGLASYRLAKWQQAERKFEQYLSLESSQNVAFLLADVLLKQGKKRAALMRLDHYRTQVVVVKEQALLLAELYLNVEKYLDAFDLLQELEREYPADLQVLLALAKLHIKRGQFEQAQAALDRATDQASPEWMLVQAYLLFHQRIYGKSQEIVWQLMALEQVSPEIKLLSIRNLFALQQVEQAVKQAQALYLEYPSELDPALAYSAILSQIGRNSEARVILEGLLKTFPQQKEIWLLLVDVYQRSGKVNAAIELLKEKARPDDFPSSLRLAQLYYTERLYVESDKVLQSLQFHHGLNPDYLVLKAKVMLARKDFESTLPLLAKLRSQWQHSPEALIQLSDLYLQANQVADAQGILEQVLATSPDSVAALERSVQIALSVNKPDAAHQLLHRLSKLPVSRSKLAFLEGGLKQAEGELEAAFSLYQESLSHDLSNSSAFVKLTVLAQQDGFRSQYIEFMEQLLSQSPARTYYRHQFADFLILQGLLKEAQVHYQILLSQPVPKGVRAQALNNLAYGLIQQGEYPSAAENALLALELVPEQASFLDTAGWALTLNGKFEQGLVYLRESLARASSNPDTRFHLAYALAKVGRWQEAQENYNEFRGMIEQFAEQERLEELILMLKDKPVGQ